jgi:cell division protein FtsZ
MEKVLTGFFDFPKEQPAIIKVIGVGGGGGNAVTHMYREGIEDVTFALCNTDNQALIKSEVPVKIQLGRELTNGLGTGNDPNLAKQAAEASRSDIQRLLNDGTRMVFVTAGMGGGTGTGAAPVIAGIAKEMGVLTVGIVTIPFLMELEDKIIQALRGVEEMRKNVDALLVINNQRLIDVFGHLDFPDEAFAKADSTLTDSAKSIAEIITIPGKINVDFADVNTTLKDGGVAIMNSGYGEGENRLAQAFEDALNSPLLNNNNAFHAKKVLFNIYYNNDKPLKTSEMNDAKNFMTKFKSKNIKVIWGMAKDKTLENSKIKVTILASGFGIESIDPGMETITQESNRQTEDEERKIRHLIDIYYRENTVEEIAKPKPFIFKSIDQMEDNTTIEALIAHPAYKRAPNVIDDIIKKAEARRQPVVSEQE